MRLITFFTEAKWAYGRLHFDLCKYLFNFNMHATITSWTDITCSYPSFNFFNACDSVVTTTGGLPAVLDGRLPIEKVLLVFHSLKDITDYINNFSDVITIDKFRKIGAVSKFLVNSASDMLNIPKTRISLLPIGVDLTQFNWATLPKALETIGYAGAYVDDSTELPIGSDREWFKEVSIIKRSWLVKEIAIETRLNFIKAQDYNMYYTTMGGFYSIADCIICSSCVEGAGMPVLEASAAGRLVMSTPVGHWEDYNCLGHTLPVDSDNFKKEAISILSFYKNNPESFVRKCKEIKDYSVNYSWINSIKLWASFLY